MNDDGIYCLDCGFHFTNSDKKNTNRPCPKCSSVKKRIHVSTQIKATILISLRGQAKNKNLPKKKRLRWDSFSGYEINHRLGKLVKKIRVIDRDKNTYKEIVIDPDTKEIIHHCEEPLDKHTGRGSAKKKWYPFSLPDFCQVRLIAAPKLKIELSIEFSRSKHGYTIKHM